MAKKNPPPVPPLRTLADTPAKQRDIQDLHTFLFLLWNSLGGGSDLIEDLLHSSQGITAMQGVVGLLERKLEQIEMASERLAMIEHQIAQLQGVREEFSVQAELAALHKRINDLELQ